MRLVDMVGMWIAYGIIWGVVALGVAFFLFVALSLLWVFTTPHHKEIILQRLDRKLEEMKEEK